MWPFSSKEDQDTKKEEKREQAANDLKHHARYVNFDQRLKNYAALVSSELIHNYVPTQNDSEFTRKVAMKVANVAMPDYGGNLKDKNVLAKMDKEFLPLPDHTRYWCEKKEFYPIKNHVTNEEEMQAVILEGTSENENDTSENKIYNSIAHARDDMKSDLVYVVTCYPAFADSNELRTSTDLADNGTNKHWYSHDKSALYDKEGVIAGINPEIGENDTLHDATTYVPSDSVSYAINCKKLGLEEDDVKEGFIYQSRGMNVMDPKMQESIFSLKKSGFTQEEILNLWDNNLDFKDVKNIEKIEQHMANGGSKEEIFADLSKEEIKKGLTYEQIVDFWNNPTAYSDTNNNDEKENNLVLKKKESLNLSKVKEGENRYKYNLQDHSCAIQPTAPILYATSAKIDRENMNAEEANNLREDIGLYNIYDEENYGKINSKFYEEYKKETKEAFRNWMKEGFKEFLDDPKGKMKEIKGDIKHSAGWASAKMKLNIPRMIEIAMAEVKAEENKDTNVVEKQATQETPLLTTKFIKNYTND